MDGYRVLEASLAGQTVTPPRLLVAQPIGRTLYVVVDPAKVEDDVRVRDSERVWQRVVILSEFREFLGNAVKATMEPYFAAVAVVNAPPTETGAPYFLADLRLDGITAHSLQTTRFIYARYLMQWAFAIRGSSQREYAFSFAGEGASTESFQDPAEGCEQMLTSALNAMMAKWTEADVFRRLSEIHQNEQFVPTPSVEEGVTEL